MTHPWRHGFLAFGILVPVVGIALAATHRERADGSSALSELGRERILLARTSVGGRWSSCEPSPVAMTGYCRPPEETLRAVEPRQLGTPRSRGRDDSEEVALASLLLGRGAGRLERALTRLEAVARKRPDQAEPFIDLAAGQLTFGWAQGSAGSFADALESAERALEIDPANAPACFNRALALEELGLREIALEGWERCASVETDTEWRSEILQRTEDLQKAPTTPSRAVIAAALERAVRENRRAELARIAQDHPHLAADLVARDLLPQWMGSGPIDPSLPGLEVLAEEIGRQTGDRFLADVVGQIRSGLSRGLGPEMAEGVGLWKDGLAAYRERRFEETVDRLEASMADLQAVPALQVLVRTYGAIALRASGRSDAARQELLILVADAGERGYGWPQGLAHATLGRIAIKKGHLPEAIAHYHQAILIFAAIRAEDLLPYARILQAEIYGDLGQTERALQLGRQALHEAHRLGVPDRLFLVLNLFAGIADEQGREGLALYLQTSALHYAAGEPPRSRANAHIWRAYLLSRQSFHERAQADLRRARELIRAVADPTEKISLDAELALAEGALAAQTGQPEAAADRLDRASLLFDQTEDRFARLIALRIRSEALRELGRLEEAVASLEEAMAVHEVSVRDFSGEEEGSSETDRLSYLRQNSNVYQAMVDLHAGKLADPWTALIFAEHAKSLRAPGSLRELSRDESQIDRWRQALPTDTALLSYGTAEGLVVAWLLTPESRQFFRLGSFAEVSVLAGRLDRSREAESWEALSRELHQHLISPPLAAALRPVRRLLVVPCPGLDRVPFPGLQNSSGHYLAETHLLELLPSASVLLREPAPPERPDWWRRALIIGDPKPTSAGLLGLPRLRFAEREARDVEELLGRDTLLLIGPEATPRRFLEEAATADLIHVAGHAVSLGRGPDAAALVLATGEGDEEGLLRAREILGLRLLPPRLVVLSACSSAAGPGASWQSGLTLARSFLSVGAEQVVATLRAVDDEESAKLFHEFYRELARGRDAADSLRSAQLKVLDWRRQTRRTGAPTWPFVVILDGGPSK